MGKPTPGHPELDVERGIENIRPLGQGHTMALGSAITERFPQQGSGALEQNLYLHFPMEEYRKKYLGQDGLPDFLD